MCIRDSKKLQPVPFEILVEMIFARSGWRRVGSVGKAKRDTDISLEIPLTGERACVQVKTSAAPQDLVNWIKFKEETSAYSRMFFVYHTSSAPFLVNDEEEIIKILGAHEAVSYTHLDVYKRQLCDCASIGPSAG